MNPACGLDFGTSNSTVGWHRPGKTCLLVLEENRVTLPSVVFFNSEEQETCFGRQALDTYLAGYEGRLMRSLKSLLGTSLMEGQTEVMGKILPFRQLLEQFIQELKRRAEVSAGVCFERAVLGRPVFFVDGDPESDRRAQQTLTDIALSTGFVDIAFQYEPIAAAFAYEAQIQDEQLVLVADIGGGTSDFSLVRLGPQRMYQPERRDDILASGGVHLGGTDFDKYLSLHAVMPELGMGGALKSGNVLPASIYFDLATWHTINAAYTPKARKQLHELRREVLNDSRFERLCQLVEQRDGHWLAHQVEQAKIALSAQSQINLSLDRLSPTLLLTIARAQLEQALSHLLTEIGATLESVLQDAGVRAEAVDTIFMTGGSSGMPALQHKLASLLPAAQLVRGDPFGSIGTGLALDAARKFG